LFCEKRGPGVLFYESKLEISFSGVQSPDRDFSKRDILTCIPIRVKLGYMGRFAPIHTKHGFGFFCSRHTVDMIYIHVIFSASKKY